MRADAQRNYQRLLAVAHDLIAEHGAETSLRDISRRAGVGLGTLHRHFPRREVLLEALLRSKIDQLAVKADALASSAEPAEALVSWLHDAVSIAHAYRGAINTMVAAIADTQSALHASCTSMKAAGGRLLSSAQQKGLARTDIDGSDLFGLLGALAWLRDQPPLAERADRLFDVIVNSLLIKPS